MKSVVASVFLLAIAIFTIFMALGGPSLSSLTFGDMVFLLKVAGYYLVVTAVIYTIAAFIKSGRIRKWFFAIVFVVTFLPLIPANLMIIFWDYLVAREIDSTGSAMGVGLMLSFLFIAGAAFNPPVIFAYVAHKIVPPGKLRLR